MQEAKTIDFSNRPKDAKNVNPGCPIWIFGNEDSVDNDLKKKFEVVENGKKN